MDDFSFSDNKDASRYELRQGGALMAWIDYRLQDGIVVLTHTEVVAASEGQGLGSKVADRALDEVRRRGLKVRPACDFVARFIERNHTTVAARHLPLHWLLLLPVWTVIRWGVLAKTVLRSRAMPSDDPSPPVRETIVAVLRGLVEGIVRLPRSLRERRLLGQHATVGARDWRALLAAHRAHIGDYERFGA